MCYYSAPVGEQSIVVSLSACDVCVSVCPRAYLWNRFTDLNEFCCADPLWPWLGPPLAALQYVMFFQFMDDVTFGRSGAAWRCAASGVAIPMRSLMSMKVWMPCSNWRTVPVICGRVSPINSYQFNGIGSEGVKNDWNHYGSLKLVVIISVWEKWSTISTNFVNSLQQFTWTVLKHGQTRKVAMITMYCHLRSPDAIAFPT